MKMPPKMKVGALVKAHQGYATHKQIGIVLDIDKDFYRIGNSHTTNRIKVFWINSGFINHEPEEYLLLLKNKS
jgi:hypothetical protein